MGPTSISTVFITDFNSFQVGMKYILVLVFLANGSVSGSGSPTGSGSAPGSGSR